MEIKHSEKLVQCIARSVESKLSGEQAQWIASSMEIKISAPPERQYAVWRGVASLGSPASEAPRHSLPYASISA